jgi:GTPase
MQEINQIPRFMLVGVIPKRTNDEDMLADMEELESLVKTYKGIVVAATVQKANRPNRETFIGTGKSQEIADTILAEKVDIVVVNDILKPGQIYTLEKIFARSNDKIKVWDRMDLILQIFSQNANTREAKLQIELASLVHMGPRAYGMGLILGRQGGGIGNLGAGETNTELMKRHWRNEMKHIQDQLDKQIHEREKQIEIRKNIGYTCAAIVGYTNAGKTMLFNRLTSKENFVADRLFATLDSVAGKLYLPSIKKEVIVTDTIGFIKNLPTSLIDAFKSTLLESVSADVLMVVIDATEKNFADKIRVVSDILYDLMLEKKHCIYVFNKMDKLPLLDKTIIQSRYEKFHPQFISAMKGEGIEALLSCIGDLISRS